MKINNKYFGEIAYTAQETIYFPEGLFGFEEQKEFLPIPFADYDPKISEADRSAIGSPADEDISYYVIGVIREELSDSTVNLKAPIAVNFHTRDARQIILEDPAYTFRHSLGEQKGKEE